MRNHSRRGQRFLSPPGAWFAACLVAVSVWVTKSSAIDKAPVLDRVPVDRVTIESWWEKLEKPELEASRALLRLSDHPREVIPFLRTKLLPVRLSERRFDELLEQLGNDEEEIWKAAFEEFEYFDPRLAVPLEKIMERVTESPARQRIVEVMSGRTPGSLEGTVILREVGGGGHNFYSEVSKGSWWAESKISQINYRYSNRKVKWNRAVRAIVLLRHFETPAADAILEDLAKGHPEAQPTRAAREALETHGDPTKEAVRAIPDRKGAED